MDATARIPGRRRERGRRERLRKALWLGPKRDTLLALVGFVIGTIPAAILLLPRNVDTAAPSGTPRSATS